MYLYDFICIILVILCLSDVENSNLKTFFFNSNNNL